MFNSTRRLANLGIRAGSKVVEICHTWKNSETEVQERIVIVEMCWERSRVQVDFMRQIASTIDPELCRIMDNLLSQLAIRLELAVKKIQEVVDRESCHRPGLLGFGSRVRKTAYLMKKDALDNIIQDLEIWQRRFDPSWFLLMKIANPVIDQELQKARARAPVSNPTTAILVKDAQPAKVKRAVQASETSATAAISPLALASGLRDALSRNPKQPAIFLPPDLSEFAEIPHSTARAARRKAGDARWYIIDSVHCRPGADVSITTRDVRDLATKLSRADPFAFGLLQCKGVVRVGYPAPSRQIQAFDFVFRAPYETDALQSLRQLLVSSDENISLTRKFRIACQLARSVNYVHTFNFVHKNIRPESILCFEDVEAGKSHTFLVGFDVFRSADGGTMLLGDIAWDRNVYRHPHRQGQFLTEQYDMRHDVYSLGVCLLEIGLWESFVDYGDGDKKSPSRLGESFQRFKAWLDARNSEEEHTMPRNARFLEDLSSRLKDYLVETAKEKLPARMGDKYTKVVVSCLTCLDERDDIDELEKSLDNDGILAGCHFIETILQDLDTICL